MGRLFLSSEGKVAGQTYIWVARLRRLRCGKTQDKPYVSTF